ncbi:sporulation protein [Clostridium niameyense]|uniref:Sporulation protein n=1 Tax=Clostridium niameyense TaxID=1622073 RepID=A0A6M0R9G6_9CLOT|nr:YtrH family sporulation protein [Clostridium niameyense]NEZ46846.1 sporulation protein [Clostridium niameyense]
MRGFVTNIIYSFLVAFGVVIGGSAFAGIGAIINNDPPLKIMTGIANSIKIWAVAIALGGTFSSFSILEEGIFRGEFRGMIKQIFYIMSALIGANLAFKFIKLIDKCGEIWKI